MTTVVQAINGNKAWLDNAMAQRDKMYVARAALSGQIDRLSSEITARANLIQAMEALEPSADTMVIPNGYVPPQAKS